MAPVRWLINLSLDDKTFNGVERDLVFITNCAQSITKYCENMSGWAVMEDDKNW